MVLLHHMKEETKGKQRLVLRMCQVGWSEAGMVGRSLGSVQLVVHLVLRQDPNTLQEQGHFTCSHFESYVIIVKQM